MKKTKNLKGFTLVEEVVSLFILSILILVASGMMIAAMRVYSVNVKTQSAQNKGQYVYDLLDDKLTYASGIQYQTIKETDGATEISPLDPPNETYFKGGEMKKIFEDDEVCQNITVDKNGITNSFNNKKIEFGQYNVDVSLELETQTTTAASASADNSMNDEALFNLVSNSEVTDLAGYLTPQGEVSFLGSLEIMNQSAEVRTVSNIGDNLNYRRENDYYLIDNIPNDVSCVEITVENKNPNPYEYIYLSYQTSSDVSGVVFNKPFTEETFSINLDFDSWIKLFNPDKYNIKSVKVEKKSNIEPLEININGAKYHSSDNPRVDMNFDSTLNIESNKSSQIEKITFTNRPDWWLWSQDYKGDGYFSVTESDKLFSLIANSYNNNLYYVTIKSGNERINVQVNVLPFPLSVTIDGQEHYDNFSINIEEGEKKELIFNTDSKDLKKICYYTDPAEIYTDEENGKIYLSGKKQGQTSYYFEYGGKQITVTVNVTKPEDKFNIIPTNVKYLVVNDNDTDDTANKGFQIQTNKTENGNLTENAKKTYEKIEYYFVDDSGNRIETDIAEISETGYVTAKKAGTVKICATAKRKDGKADEVSTNKVTISVSEPISVSPNEITVFAGDEFNSLPFEVKNSTNYETSVAPWGITFNSNGMQVNKDCNDNSTVTVTFRDRSNNSTATLTIHVVKFKILKPTDNNINLQKGKSLKFESNYGQDGISRGSKKFSIEIADQTLISIDENGTNNDITKTIKATSDKIGGSNVIVKFGSENIQYYYINVVEKEKTLKIDNSSEDKDITLWAGETHTFQLSSTLENFNSIHVENPDLSVLSYDCTQNEDGTFALTITALKPDRDTDVVLTVTDRYYSTSTSDNSVIADEKGIPIKINVQIKVPQIDTTPLTIYLNESTEFNIGDIPFDYMSCSSERATVVDAKKDNGKIIFTPYSKTTEPIKITLTYNCGDVSYSFEVLVTVTDRPVTSTTTTTKATTVTTTTTTTVAVSKSDKPISSYRLKLTVTVRDKKGKEMYKRSGSISVINYENSNMKDKRFPTDMSLNNTSDSGFVLKIYYID